MERFIIPEPEEKAPCEYCGIEAYLRPYGKKGAKICIKCGMKPENKKTTNKMAFKVMHESLMKERPSDAQKN